ncbi:MAG: GIY-YIG nuclease family protein [Ramlibacter sp.]|jgi:hypothetical protein|nr:GIY-YIG nuclease family protein [Ramlibacter sp.]
METLCTSSRSSPKELKRIYKEQPPAMGVWTVRNSVTGSVFVAASMNVEGAINRARFELRQNQHRNQRLMQEWRTHGADSFSFDVVDTLKRRDDPAYDYSDDLAALLALWEEELAS